MSPLCGPCVEAGQLIHRASRCTEVPKQCPSLPVLFLQTGLAITSQAVVRLLSHFSPWIPVFGILHFSLFLSCLSHFQPLLSNWEELQQLILKQGQVINNRRNVFNPYRPTLLLQKRKKQKTKCSNISIYSQNFILLYFVHLYVLSFFAISFLFPQGKKARESIIIDPGSRKVNLSQKQ